MIDYEILTREEYLKPEQLQSYLGMSEATPAQAIELESALQRATSIIEDRNNFSLRGLTIKLNTIVDDGSIKLYFAPIASVESVQVDGKDVGYSIVGSELVVSGGYNATINYTTKAIATAEDYSVEVLKLASDLFNG